MTKRKPLADKAQNPLIPVALELKRKGYDPIPLARGKEFPFKGWPETANEASDIANWGGRALAVRMLGSDDLFVIDLDIQLEPVLERILAAYEARWPEFMGRVVRRHSGRVTLALFGRLTTGLKHMHSGRWGVCEAYPKGHRVELFTANDSRYVVVWGMHSEGREYGYSGPVLWDVVQRDLPEFLDADLNELLEIADREMAAAGLEMAEPAGLDSGEVVYDLRPEMVAETKQDGQLTLAELETAATGRFVYVHGRLFDGGSGTFRIKAKWTPSCGLVLWDFGDGGKEHRWAHLGPQVEVLVPLLKKLVDDEAARIAPGGSGTTMFAAPDDMATGSLTQDGVALVFANRLAESLQYCHDTGRWYLWTGVYWQPQRTKLAFHYCRELGREFSAASGRTELKEVRKVSFAGGVEKFAQADPRMATTADWWDRDTFLLGTPQGTLDLRTGVLRAADPAERITRLTAVAPGSAATPLWDKFLLETFKGDRGLIAFSQQWFGYCLTGDIREHALWFGFGEGGNGKGVLLNTITGIMQDYAVTAAMDTFVAAKGDRHSTELAMLKGARLVTASETEKGRAWAESRIKQITGGDPVTARFMRQDNFTFSPQFKLTLIGNHKPVLRGVDDAVKRRFNLVPFLNKPEVVDRQLEHKLRAEWAGILGWMVQGCLLWQRDGLVRPESVKRATDSYFEDQDTTGQWLMECCEMRPGSAVFESTAALFASWHDYANKAGEYVGTRKSFATELARRGFDLFKQGDANVRSVRGIKLKQSSLAKAILSIVPNDLGNMSEDKK